MGESDRFEWRRISCPERGHCCVRGGIVEGRMMSSVAQLSLELSNKRRSHTQKEG